MALYIWSAIFETFDVGIKYYIKYAVPFIANMWIRTVLDDQDPDLDQQKMAKRLDPEPDFFLNPDANP